MWKTLVVLALAGAAAWGWNARRGRGEPTRTAQRPIWHTVARGDFELAITERGEIDSVGDIEIRSEVKSKNTTGIAILKIVPEGTVVKQGDFLAKTIRPSCKKNGCSSRSTSTMPKRGSSRLAISLKPL